ncbi:restriction endonuclease [Candidatus Latescibacterota bacterium]
MDLSTSDQKIKCKAQTRKGQACKQFPMKDCEYCYAHSLGRTKGVIWWKNPAVHLVVAIVTLVLSAIFFCGGPSRKNQKTIINNQITDKIERRSMHEETRALVTDLIKRADSTGGAISSEDSLAYMAIVLKIYGDLQPEAVIHSRDRIPSQTSSSSHVVDISIRSDQSGQEVLTVVNVNPGTSPVDEHDVLEFARLLTDVGASKGVLVCNSGFTRAAKALAPSVGIGLCTIQDAQSRKWSDDIKVPVLMIELKARINFNIIMHLEEGDTIPRSLDRLQFSIDEGATTFTISELFTDLWNRNSIPHNPQEPQQIDLDYSGWKFRVESPQKWVPADSCRLVYKIVEETWLKYYTPLEYTAIQDHLSQNVKTTSLHVKIGPFIRDDSWIRVSDQKSFVSRSKGVIFVLKEVLTTIDEFTDEGMQMRKIR